MAGKIRKGISFVSDQFDRIERDRGTLDRSAFVRKVITEYYAKRDGGTDGGKRASSDSSLQQAPAGPQSAPVLLKTTTEASPRASDLGGVES